MLVSTYNLARGEFSMFTIFFLQYILPACCHSKAFVGVSLAIYVGYVMHYVRQI